MTTVTQSVIVDLIGPANIISTNITINQITCVEPCTAIVTITWKNTGDITGLFTPGVIVDTEPPITLTPEQLDGGQTIIRSFTLSNIMAGTHGIQAYPDTGTIPQTITVTKVATAGFGTIGMFAIAGLAIGLLLFAKKKDCRDYTDKKNCETNNCRWTEEEKKCL